MSHRKQTSLIELDAENPYRSPRADTGLALLSADPALPFHAHLMASRSLYRLIRLSGRMEAELEWDANWPVERVRLNRQVVAAQSAYFRSVPRFEFSLNAAGRVFNVVVENRIEWIYFTKAFRVTINDEIVYNEGSWPESMPPDVGS